APFACGVVIEHMCGDQCPVVDPVRRPCLLVQCHVAGCQLPGHRVGEPLGPAAVLHRRDDVLVPLLAERGQDAAVAGVLAVPVRAALPDAHGGQVRGLGRRNLPLVLRVVGDSGQADLAVAPGRRAAPFVAARESTRIQPYPWGTHRSGSTTSKFWYLLVVLRVTSG